MTTSSEITRMSKRTLEDMIEFLEERIASDQAKLAEVRTALASDPIDVVRLDAPEYAEAYRFVRGTRSVGYAVRHEGSSEWFVNNRYGITVCTLPRWPHVFDFFTDQEYPS